MPYAKTTTVSVDQSQMEIQRLLQRYTANKFAIDWSAAKILFELKGRKIQIQIPLPVASEDRIKYTPTKKLRTPDQISTALGQAIRQRWRALILVIKAKLEAIEAGITTLDNEFLPYFLLPNGQTLGDYILPQLVQPNLFPSLPEPNR